MDITLEDVLIELNNANSKEDVLIIFDMNKYPNENLVLAPDVRNYYWKYLTDKLLIKKVLEKDVVNETVVVLLEK